jgi:hypothetical protein
MASMGSSRDARRAGMMPAGTLNEHTKASVKTAERIILNLNIDNPPPCNLFLIFYRHILDSA